MDDYNWIEKEFNYIIVSKWEILFMILNLES